MVCFIRYRFEAVNQHYKTKKPSAIHQKNFLLDFNQINYNFFNNKYDGYDDIYCRYLERFNNFITFTSPTIISGRNETATKEGFPFNCLGVLLLGLLFLSFL